MVSKRQFLRSPPPPTPRLHYNGIRPITFSKLKPYVLIRASTHTERRICNRRFYNGRWSKPIFVLIRLAGLIRQQQNAPHKVRLSVGECCIRPPKMLPQLFWESRSTDRQIDRFASHADVCTRCISAVIRPSYAWLMVTGPETFGTETDLECETRGWDIGEMMDDRLDPES